MTTNGRRRATESAERRLGFVEAVREQRSGLALECR
jgi:hypothetical protein